MACCAVRLCVEPFYQTRDRCASGPAVRLFGCGLASRCGDDTNSARDPPGVQVQHLKMQVSMRVAPHAVGRVAPPLVRCSRARFLSVSPWGAARGARSTWSRRVRQRLAFVRRVAGSRLVAISPCSRLRCLVSVAVRLSRGLTLPAGLCLLARASRASWPACRAWMDPRGYDPLRLRARTAMS